MKVSHKYSIYLDRRQSDIFIDVMQGDTYTREVEFSLYSGGVAWPVPPTTSVAVVYSGPSGKGIYDTLPDGSTACNVDKNIVTATLVPKIMSMAGRTRVSLLFADGDGRQLATFTIIVRVLENPSECAGTPDDYVNIMHWTQSAISALAADFSSRLDEYAEALTQNFCYVAEDDGDGNVTLRPFHLGGFTDETLSKTGVPADAAQVGIEVERLDGEVEGLGQRIDNCAPAGFGLGAGFQKIYTLEEADNLKVPGWYLVDVGAGQLAINGETVQGVNLVRVDGADRADVVCIQTWLGDSSRSELRREYSSYYGKWREFYSINPMYIPGRIYATNEFHNGARVYSVMVDAGTVKAGETSGVDVPIANGFDDFSIIEIKRYAKPADQRRWFYGCLSGLEEYAYRSAVYDDTDGDNEVDTNVGYVYGLDIFNNTNTDLQLRYLIKYTAADAWG